MRILGVPPLVAALAACLSAQTPDKPLTNADIESMLAAGLPESTVLLKMEAATYAGLVDLDASPAALSGLKQKGATERILNAVLFAQPFGSGLKQKREEDRAVPDLPGAAGLYFKSSSGWVPVQSFLLWTPFYSGWNWFHHVHQTSIPLGSGRSGLEITNARPTFYAREPAAAKGWEILHLTSRKDQRVLRLASTGDFDQLRRTEPNQVRDVEMKHVAGGIFTLQPTADLENGEYLLCAGVQGGVHLDLCYSFGIHR